MDSQTPLLDALGVGRGEVISLVGGGGKTTLGLRLVAEAATLGWNAVFTVTTHIYPPDLPLLLGPDLPDSLPAGACCVAAYPAPEGKLAGLLPEQIGRLARLADLTVVEADGSRGHPLKFPANHEPVIPPATTLVLAVAGATAIGRPLDDQTVHRAQLAAAKLGVPLGTAITPMLVATLLWQPDAVTRGRPPGARVVPVINQVDAAERLEVAYATATALRRLGASYVLLTHASGPQPVIDVVR